jgi:hypothetical protein
LQASCAARASRFVSRYKCFFSFFIKSTSA